MNAFDEGEKEPESRDDYMRQKGVWEDLSQSMFRGLRDFGER